MQQLLIKRGVALLIDYLIILLPLYLFRNFLLPDRVSGSGRFWVSIVPFCLLLFRDFYSPAGSPGKRICGLQLLFRQELTDRQAVLRRLFRNLTLFVWPLEAIVAFLNDGKRIGDMLGRSYVLILREEKEWA